MEEFVSAKLGGTQPQQPGLDPKQIEGYVNNQIKATQNSYQGRLKKQQLDGRHPSWRDDVKTSDFNNWLTNQRVMKFVLADSQNAKDAIRMMDLFYESKQRPADTIKQSRSQRLAKAANPG